VTSSEPPQRAPARRSRRAVRHAGTVGGDDANLVSSHPAFPAGPLRDTDAIRGDAVRDDVAHDPTAVTGRAGEGGSATAQPDAAREPAVATRSADDSDVGWGDRAAGSNDDRLHQDKPPHW